MAPTNGKVVVCYISTWAVYGRGRGTYTIENFDPNLCTHAIYAFAGLDIQNAAIKSLDPWQDLKDGGGKGGYERLTGMKRSHPHLKVSLSIGGWNQGSEIYSQLVSDPGLRQRFVQQVSGFVRKYNFDGLDFDWEYPTQRGGKPSDRQNFVALIKELRREFDRHQLLLTAAISASRPTMEAAYDFNQLSQYLHYIHVMSYDYSGSWDKRIGFNAPLVAPQGGGSVQNSIDYLLQSGVPNHKLVLGLPFYGRTFKTFGQGAIGEATDGSTFQGPYTKEDGFMGYNEIFEELRNNPSVWSVDWDATASQAIARSTRDHAGQIRVITYDDVRSVAIKTQYAVSRGLGGVMIWTVDTDDFLGESGVRYQLLRKVNETIS